MNQPARSTLAGAALAVLAAIALFVPGLRELVLGAAPPAAPAAGEAVPGTPSTAPARAEKPAPASRPVDTAVGFTSRKNWLDHFEKHGGEFGKITAEQYLLRAQELRDAPTSADVLESVRKQDGVVCRFDKRSGAFLACNADRTIRTFFRPGDGEAYFRRQLDRLPQEGR